MVDLTVGAFHHIRWHMTRLGKGLDAVVAFCSQPGPRANVVGRRVAAPNRELRDRRLRGEIEKRMIVLKRRSRTAQAIAANLTFMQSDLKEFDRLVDELASADTVDRESLGKNAAEVKLVLLRLDHDMAQLKRPLGRVINHCYGK
ncbi:MAG: hypothetical protein HY673_25710 [Chloroflexi bacterium]|nr:hypothetical protein [Chloroflexota bacterium]